jgi:hypothetical protein
VKAWMANTPPKFKPRWPAQLRQALAGQAHSFVADSYQDAAEGVRRLGGQVLPLENARREGGPSQPRDKDDWDDTVEEGLRKTYRQGRRRLRQVAATPEPPDEQWHELRKRAKDLAYQLALLKKVKGVEPLFLLWSMSMMRLAKRLERYSKRVRELIWSGDRSHLIDALADLAEAAEIARRLHSQLRHK